MHCGLEIAPRSDHRCKPVACVRHTFPSHTLLQYFHVSDTCDACLPFIETIMLQTGSKLTERSRIETNTPRRHTLSASKALENERLHSVRSGVLYCTLKCLESILLDITSLCLDVMTSWCHVYPLVGFDCCSSRKLVVDLTCKSAYSHFIEAGMHEGTP